MVGHTKIIIRTVLYFFLIIFTASCALKQEKLSADTDNTEEANKRFAYGICIDSLAMTHHMIEKGDHLSSILTNMGFTGSDAEQITRTISPYYPPSKLQIGNRYAALTTRDSIAAIQYLVFERSRTDFAVVDLSGDTLRAYESSKPVTLQRRYCEGTITSSMWNAIIGSGAPRCWL